MVYFSSILFSIVVMSTCADSVSGQVSVEYLKGVKRLNQSNYMDYYTSCNAIGRYIQWLYNDEPLTVLGAGHTGRVVVDTRNGYEYTASLLSSQPHNESTMLDSILVISTVNRLVENFAVRCSSDSGSQGVTVSAKDGKIESTVSDIEIRMDYVLSSRTAVQNKNRTYIFVCGAKNKQLILTIDNFQFLFNEGDNVGDDRTILSEDGNTIDSQSVLVARQHPFNFTSIIFIVMDADVIVTCLSGSHQVQLFSNNLTTTSTELTSDGSVSPRSTTSSSSTSVSSSSTSVLERNTTLDPSFASSTIPIGVGVAAAVALTLILITLGLAVFYFKRKKCNDLHNHLENGEPVFRPKLVQDCSYNCMSQLVNCARRVIKSNKAHSSVVPKKAISERSSSQENDSQRSISEESISDESEIASASNIISTEDTIKTKQSNTLHTDLRSASQNTSEESTRLNGAENGHVETEHEETLLNQNDEVRKDLGSSIHGEYEEMKDYVNCFTQTKQPVLVGERENSQEVGEYAQESKEAANLEACPVYISSSNPIKINLKKKYCLLWSSDESSRVSGSVVAGDLLKEIEAPEETDSLRRHEIGMSSVYPDIEDVPLELLGISTEKDTTASDEHEGVAEFFAVLVNFSVCELLLIAIVPIFNIWYAIVATISGVWKVTLKLEQIALNMVAKIVVGGTETYSWVSVNLLHWLHFTGSEFLEVLLRGEFHMSPKSSTSLWWGRATPLAAKLQQTAVATEGYEG